MLENAIQLSLVSENNNHSHLFEKNSFLRLAVCPKLCSHKFLCIYNKQTHRGVTWSTKCFADK